MPLVFWKRSFRITPVWNTGFAQTCSKGVTKEYRKQEASGLDLSYLRVPEQRAVAHVDASDYGVYSEPST
jgi:hypothetical protein